MNIQGVNNGDSWDRFVRLVADARSRSAQEVVKQTTVNRSEAAAQSSRSPALARYNAARFEGRGETANALQTRSQVTGLEAKTRTIGTRFDAYA